MLLCERLYLKRLVSLRFNGPVYEARLVGYPTLPDLLGTLGWTQFDEQFRIISKRGEDEDP